MSAESNRSPSRSSLRLLPALSLFLWCSFLPGCCKTCIRPPLPVELHPAMRQVVLYPPQAPEAEYCLTDRGRRDVLVNLEGYRAALEAARETLRIYNEKVKEQTP